MRTRERAKGRRGGDVEHFAKIPVSVLESAACKTLPHAAFKVLTILAAQYRGRNNGTLALTPAFAERFGLVGNNTIYRSLKTLTDRGLLVLTRDGWRMKNHFALYALGWEDITHRDGKPLNTAEPRNVRRWLDWRPLPAVGNGAAQIGTHHGEC